jgi:hypothetical protein
MKRKDNFDDDIRHIWEETAGALAADRQTRTLPVVLAEIIFIGGWIISLVKAASSEPGPTNWVNVEAQSIAISALYLWVTFTVVIGSLIGASQTEDSVPRILHSFEYQLAAFQGGSGRRPSMKARSDMMWCRRSTDRALHGGLYSWRPHKWRQGTFNVEASAIFLYSCTAIAVVGSSLLISAVLSYLVAPQGFNCRHIPEALV